MQTQRDCSYSDFTLLVDGKNTFPKLLSCMEHAKKSILINMFIWRDDEIGNRLAQAVLDAADRGVAVTLSIDRYGVVLEKCEENKRSFFHKKQNFGERIKIKALECLYPAKGTPKRGRDVLSPLYLRMLEHPNIILDCDRFKADHSKYYVFDNEILFLGGINVEDKENGADMQGRVYQDYMVMMVGKDHVAAFFDKLERGEDTAKGYSFAINRKKSDLFEMEQTYLDLIRSAKRELHITMSYFSPLPRLLCEIVAAHRRGVSVTVLLPASSNFQNSSNRKAAKMLMRRTDNGIRLLFSPKMVHTKMIMTEDRISLGSTNLTKKSFAQLDELNLCLARTESAFCDALLASIAENVALCERVCDEKQISYNRLLAFLESFLV